jgi:aspartyl-tRNA(Asn)/glutamyl-tRNA(Gln) amidotransferase subunit A
MVEARPHE